MVVFTCAALLVVAVLFTATLTASILLGLVTGSLAAVAFQGTRELFFRLRKRWRARMPSFRLRRALAFSIGSRFESPRKLVLK